MPGNTVQIFTYNMNPTTISGRIWHSSVVVFGQEFTFGQRIGQSCGTPGNADEIFEVGETFVNERQFRSFLEKLKSDFNSSTYHLGNNNCNVYSLTLCNFLCENPLIPESLQGQKALEMSVTIGSAAAKVSSSLLVDRIVAMVLKSLPKLFLRS